MTTKQIVNRLSWARAACDDLIAGLSGNPFYWGHVEADHKESALMFFGYGVVSLTKLTKGGHELKRGAKPVGSRYYKSPLNLRCDLYVLGVQTKRSSKWRALADKGRALLEDGTIQKESSFWAGPLVPKELVPAVEAKVKELVRANRDAKEKEAAAAKLNGPRAIASSDVDGYSPVGEGPAENEQCGNCGGFRIRHKPGPGFNNFKCVDCRHEWSEPVAESEAQQ